MKQYDLIVIGAGSGGVRAARMSAAEGKSVALIERQFLGGTCVNVGCVPKKLFVYASHYNEDFHQAEGFGWSLPQEAKFDWPTLVRNKNAEIERLNGIYGNMLKNAGVDLYWGSGSISDVNTVTVATQDAGDQTIIGDKILIAVGGKPFIPEFDGAEHVIDSNDAFYLESLPDDIVVVGGGYIAVEFAGIFNGLGVNTTLVYRGKQILRHFDDEIGAFVTTQIQDKGIDIKLEHDIERIEKLDQGYQVFYNNGETQQTKLVMYATGRVPVFEGLGLDNTRINFTSSGKIAVNQQFETDEPNVYALGDIIDGPELTPVALAEAMAFVSTQYKDAPQVVDYDNIPTAVFCQPNIGTVGLTEAQAREKYGEITLYKSDFRHLKHTLSGDSERTFLKLIVENEENRVVGAHMVGSEAGEIMQGLAIAVKAGLTKAQWDQTVGIHPTAAEEFVTMRVPSGS